MSGMFCSIVIVIPTHSITGSVCYICYLLQLIAEFTQFSQLCIQSNFIYPVYYILTKCFRTSQR